MFETDKSHSQKKVESQADTTAKKSTNSEILQDFHKRRELVEGLRINDPTRYNKPTYADVVKGLGSSRHQENREKSSESNWDAPQSNYDAVRTIYFNVCDYRECFKDIHQKTIQHVLDLVPERKDVSTFEIIESGPHEDMMGFKVRWTDNFRVIWVLSIHSPNPRVEKRYDCQGKWTARLVRWREGIDDPGDHQFLDRSGNFQSNEDAYVTRTQADNHEIIQNTHFILETPTEEEWNRIYKHIEDSIIPRSSQEI